LEVSRSDVESSTNALSGNVDFETLKSMVDYVESLDESIYGEPHAKKPSTTKSVFAADSILENHSSAEPVHPHYFIAQITVSGEGIGVLINACECPPDSPVYMLFNSGPSLSTVMCPTQVWEVRDYKWHKLRRHLVGYHHRSQGGDGVVCVEEYGGMPWMIDDTITHQATADTGAIRLVNDTMLVVKSKGRVHSIAETPRDERRYAMKVSGCETCGSHLLCRMQFDGEEAELKGVEIGDPVEVELVKLPARCLVGEMYVLPPEVEYSLAKAPFVPVDEVIVSSDGHYLPIRFRRATTS